LFGMTDVEIEIKVRVQKIGGLVKFLKKSGRFLGQSHQIDDYFTPPHRNFTAADPITEWLRLRDSDGKFSVTYKFWHMDKNAKSTYCDEYQTDIADITKLKKIFQALDFSSLVTVDKIRRTWQYRDYEISLDAVTGLGDYVEIEYRGPKKATAAKAIGAQMIGFLKKHGCGKIERDFAGYPHRLLFPHESRFEEV